MRPGTGYWLGRATGASLQASQCPGDPGGGAYSWDYLRRGLKEATINRHTYRIQLAQMRVLPITIYSNELAQTL